jgi:Cysteine-rich secretory protein family
MKKRILSVFLIFAISIIQISAKADSTPLPSNNASWLEILNYYRQSSGLSPVTEDEQMTDGAQKHAIYLSKTSTSYFVNEYQNLHQENPASPFYSQEGVALGAGDIAWENPSFPRPIDGLMTAPFHAIGFLREGLKKVGFGSAVVEQSGFYPGTQVSDVAIIAGTNDITRTKNILFPGENSEIYINDFTGENPEPREACGSNYKSYKGLPIFASLLNAPTKDLSAEIQAPDGKLLKQNAEFCIVTENNFFSTDKIYGPAGRAIIAADHLVLLIPRDPLKTGSYSVTINQSGRDKISWAFRYRDSLPKVENKVTVVYPHAIETLYSGDTVKIQVMYVDIGISARITGMGTTCNSKWTMDTLIVTGKNKGSCTVKISMGATKNTKAFSKIFIFNYLKKPQLRSKN